MQDVHGNTPLNLSRSRVTVLYEMRMWLTHNCVSILDVIFGKRQEYGDSVVGWGTAQRCTHQLLWDLELGCPLITDFLTSVKASLSLLFSTEEGDNEAAFNPHYYRINKILYIVLRQSCSNTWR